MRNPSSASASTSCKTPCCSKVGIKRGPWTPEEDEILANFVNKEGQGQWRTLPKRAGLLRCGKSCRLRWMNYLRPSVKRGRIAPDEEDLILRLHRLLGNRWSLIAGRIPGRTDNEIKNYWNTHLSKKLINQGIDPRTHKPLNPNIPSNCPNIVANGSDHINSSTVSKCPNPNPKPNNNSSNPNHNSSAGGGNPNDIQSQNPIADDHHGVGNIINGTGFESSHDHGNIKGYSTNELLKNEDNLSSFLDSLINEENGFGNNQVHHHHVVQETTNGVAPIGLNEPALPTPLFTENWDYYGGLSLEAELRYAMDTLGGDDDHHHNHQQSSTFHNINHTL